jgi:hypothetical protein
MNIAIRQKNDRSVISSDIRYVTLNNILEFIWIINRKIGVHASTRRKKMIVENGHKYILACTSSKNVEHEYLIDLKKNILLYYNYTR